MGKCFNRGPQERKKKKKKKNGGQKFRRRRFDLSYFTKITLETKYFSLRVISPAQPWKLTENQGYFRKMGTIYTKSAF
jgi:hypothetical protein